MNQPRVPISALHRTRAGTDDAAAPVPASRWRDLRNGCVMGLFLWCAVFYWLEVFG